MRRLVVAPRAERDLDDILTRSATVFGEAAAERYRRLIDRAIANLLADPARSGVRTQPGLPPAIRLYALRMAAHGTPPSDRVNRPRHPVVFRYDAKEVRIVRVLHESMDMKRHLGVG